MGTGTSGTNMVWGWGVSDVMCHVTEAGGGVSAVMYHVIRGMGRVCDVIHHVTRAGMEFLMSQVM